MSSPRTFVITAGRRIIDLPVSDPAVKEFIESDNSYVDALLEQINQIGTYHFAFRDRSGLTFLDIGANIGLVSLYAYDVCDRIVAIEPAPDTFVVLNRIAERFPKIQPVNVALAATDGETVFHVNDANTTASSIVNTYGHEITVEGKTLSRVLKETGLRSVDICKMDIEGSEVDCLTTDQVTKAATIIKAYYIETHNCPTSTWQFKLGRLTEVLTAAGYGKVSIDGMSLYARRT